MFFRLEDTRRLGLIESSVGAWSVLVVADADAGATRMFRRVVGERILTFTRQSTGLRDNETGSIWNLEGECVRGTLAGKRLQRPLYSQSWWFAWSSFYTRTDVWLPTQRKRKPD
jgi:hypothetical protein